MADLLGSMIQVRVAVGHIGLDVVTDYVLVRPHQRVAKVVLDLNEKVVDPWSCGEGEV